LPATTPKGGPWPTISIVTPSFNQGVYLEETIRSILLQGYPNLEYIVVDGGSTDNSVAMIKKYDRWLSYWVSERDHGQAHAINKGLARCTGEIFNWINSDDYLLPGALGSLAQSFAGADAVAGVVINFDDQGRQEPFVSSELEVEKLLQGNPFSVYHQPGLWLERSKVIASGGIDESYQYSFEWDLALRYLTLYPQVRYIDNVLVHFRLHPQSKTVSAHQNQLQELYQVFVKLRSTAPTVSVRRACDRRIRRLDWWETVAKVRQLHGAPRLLRALQLGTAACLDPRIRFTRFTLGAIRQILLPNSASAQNQDVTYESTR
jgi:glycosyltransferase involved in cell wall biosynthesis